MWLCQTSEGMRKNQGVHARRETGAGLEESGARKWTHSLYITPHCCGIYSGLARASPYLLEIIHLLGNVELRIPLLSTRFAVIYSYLSATTLATKLRTHGSIGTSGLRNVAVFMSRSFALVRLVVTSR